MDAQALWQFWFKDGPPERWFRKDPDFDEELRRRFGHLPDLALRGELDAWATSPQGAVARVLALDQLPRNLYRGQARAFRYDSAALQAASQAIADGYEQALTVDERAFLYLPFEHSEELSNQDRSVALFSALGHALYLDYARRHRDVVARFGRFPHRNEALGRESTEEERVFLTQPGSSF